MFNKIIQEIKWFAYSLKPRIYECKDVYLIKWRGYEWIIQK